MAEVSEQYRSLAEGLKGRYDIERELGQGASATVFLAHDRRHDRLVALKVLRAEGASDEQEIRFVREIKFLARLQHPNILPLHDSGHVLDMLFYVVPFVEGPSLRDRIDRERQLQVDEVIRIGRDVADALEYAHRQGVIHRDIKPENILLSASRAVVADFGVARAMNEAVAGRLTKPGLGGPGTPAYMSPEQLLGDREIDARTDVYSLGCILYEMLAGQPPFSGKQGFVRRFTEGPTPLQSLRAGIPEALHEVIRRALLQSPEDRFDTAGQLSAALLRTANSAPSPLSQPSKRRVAPRSSTPLIGREAELTQLRSTLLANRLVSVIGPGGAGKSRLATEVAATLEAEFRDGAIVVPLSPLVSSEGLIPSLADAIGLTFVGGRDTETQLLESLSGRAMLLVLDGFEHLISSAPLISTIVQSAPALHVLVTSRERLNIRDETAIELVGLPFSSTSTSLAENESAVHLFIERARRSNPHLTPSPTDLEPIIRVCALVGGLPLGIEIAATLVRMLTFEEIAGLLARDMSAVTAPLRDLPERHRNLAAVFDGSWTLLGERERSALMRLALLRGEFDREAATRVGATSLDVVAALLDKSLVQRNSSGRFALHDVVRHFAELRLREAPSLLASAETARAEHFADYVAARESRVVGADADDALGEMAAEFENIRLGWRQAVACGRDDLLAKYLTPMYRFFVARGRYDEGNEEFGLADSRECDVLRARILTRRATLNLFQGSPSAARLLLRRAIVGFRQQSSSSVDMGIALAQLAFAASDQGRQRVATRVFARALRLLRGRAPEHEVTMCLINLATAQSRDGQYEAAEETYGEALELVNRLKNPRARFVVLSNFAVLLSEMGRHAAALSLRRQALELAQRSVDRYILGAALMNLAESHQVLGQVDRARELTLEALEQLRTAGHQESMAFAHVRLGAIERDAWRLPEAERHLMTAIGIARTIGATLIILDALGELSRLRFLQSQPRSALRFATAVVQHSATREWERRRTRDVLDRVALEYPELDPALLAEGARAGDLEGLLDELSRHQPVSSRTRRSGMEPPSDAAREMRT